MLNRRTYDALHRHIIYNLFSKVRTEMSCAHCDKLLSSSDEARIKHVFEADNKEGTLYMYCRDCYYHKPLVALYERERLMRRYAL